MSDQLGCAKLVEMLVTSLVDDKEAVSIETVESDDVITINITVAEDEVGKVIGRSGRVIKAIRTLTRAVASQDEQYPEIEVEVLG